MSTSPPTPLRELGALFLRLGTTAFGGPAAHVAMMHDEVVRRRQWLSDVQFLDLVAASNLIPGPSSTELAIHIGWARRRWAGLVLAGVAFIVPAMAITGGLAWGYVTYGSTPQLGWLLWGVKPVALAIVAQAICLLAPKAARSAGLALLGGAALAAAWAGVHELVVLLGAGLAAVLWGAVGRRASGLPAVALLLPGGGAASAVCTSGAGGAAAGASGVGTAALGATGIGAAAVSAAAASAAAAVSAGGLFAVFCKIGAVLFGSGYVLMAFLRTELVERLGWLTEAQLVDAVAAGQVTPGPLFTTATFVGGILCGPLGALAATAGIFLPAFAFVALSSPFLPRLRSSVAASRFLDGVNVASIALMAHVTIQLAHAALVDWQAWVLGAASAVVLVRFQPNAAWLVVAGALAGFARHAL